MLGLHWDIGSQYLLVGVSDVGFLFLAEGLEKWASNKGWVASMLQMFRKPCHDHLTGRSWMWILNPFGCPFAVAVEHHA